jgi:hypothetical protein
MSDPEAAILKLPDELLLDIANNVDVISLHGFALTCRRMRPIAQEALVRNATLSPINIWKLVETLQAHPGLAIALTHLRLGPMTQEHAINMIETSEAHETQADHSTCCDIIPGLYPHTDKSASKDSKARVDNFYSAGLVVLIALAKNLTAISTGTNSIDTIPVMRILFNNDNASTLCWYEQARSQLEDRLEELNVVIDPWLDRHRLPLSRCPIQPMNLSHLGRLKRLVAPPANIYSLQDKPGNWTPSDPCRVLPHSIESIRLTRISADFEVRWLSSLLRFVNSCPGLREIGLQFPYNTLSTAWYICASYQAGQRFLTLLQELKASNTLLTVSFGDLRLTDPARGVTCPSSERYITSDLVPALERCLATTHDDLEKDIQLLVVLGYIM